MERFKDRVVIVTGAGSGIGAATARRFSREGASVLLADCVRDRVEAVAQELPSERTSVQVVDVAKVEDLEAMVDAAVERFGKLDTLVSNAGIVVEGTVLQSSVEDWRRVSSINIDGVIFGARAALPHLIKTKGSIVNTASISGLRADWGLALYNATKGAVVNFTRSLALDHGADGVRANSVCPCVTYTAMSASATADPAWVARVAERIALGRLAQPTDVAAAIAFLASDDASFITGVNLPVDGGVTASDGQPKLF